MINIEYIRLDTTKITEMLSYAFRPLMVYQKNLKGIHIRSHTIQKVGNYAFYDLNSLMVLSFGENLIDFITSNVFHFRKESKTLFCS